MKKKIKARLSYSEAKKIFIDCLMAGIKPSEEISRIMNEGDPRLNDEEVKDWVNLIKSMRPHWNK
jgi:hypothetical protein